MWNRAEDKVKAKLVFIRHGETKGNLEKRYIGKTDESLCEEGRQRILKLVDEGRYPQPDFVFVSPMKRCLETCQIIYPSWGAKEIEEFREIDFGLFENKNFRELEGDINYNKWIESNGKLPFPGGESRECFMDRCFTGFLKACDEMESCTKKEFPTAAFVVHGGTIMSIMNRLFGKTYFDWQVENGSGFIVEDDKVVKL